jgi:hypothetical protein
MESSSLLVVAAGVMLSQRGLVFKPATLSPFGLFSSTHSASYIAFAAHSPLNQPGHGHKKTALPAGSAVL